MARSHSHRGNLLRALISGLGCAAGASCAFHGDALQGAVFEVQNPDAPPAQWKKLPLAGAEVLVVWNGKPADDGDESRAVCLRALSTFSDSQGHFAVPGWYGFPSAKQARLQPPVSYVYLTGYEEMPPQPAVDRAWSPEAGVHLMRKSRQPGAAAAREAVFSAARDCPG
ncbi:MAG TPA: hypothetical protein VG994_02350 [Steroidobacteraceae bacterium]|nr:hypothetical protein [Steroidobacteraceae bacterium]